MGYKLKMIGHVLIWDDKEKRYNRKETATLFSCATTGGITSLIREMALYAEDPLTFEIIKEED